jgi:hypothetical protein
METTADTAAPVLDDAPEPEPPDAVEPEPEEPAGE